jgi:hypothetical protein
MNETNQPRICVPVCEQYVRDLPQAIARAAEAADIIELRLDCLENAELTEVAREFDSLLATRHVRSFLPCGLPNKVEGASLTTRALHFLVPASILFRCGFYRP